MARKIQIAEESLVSMLSEGNTEGMEILYDNYASALYGVINRIVQRDGISEDVLQETFLKIWNNFSQYDPSKGRLFTWMINIARNLAIDKVRSKEFSQNQKNQSLYDSVSSMDLEKQPAFNPETIGLREMVSKLNSEYRQIIDLLFFGGYTQHEAAEKLNIPLGTVKTRSRAAIMKLRQQFEKEEIQ